MLLKVSFKKNTCFKFNSDQIRNKRMSNKICMYPSSAATIQRSCLLCKLSLLVKLLWVHSTGSLRCKMEFYFQINITCRIRFVLINYVVIGKLKSVTLLYTQSGLADWVSDSPIFHKMLMKCYGLRVTIYIPHFSLSNPGYDISDMVKQLSIWMNWTISFSSW